MAFKSVKTYNEEKYGGLFILPNDGDFADVVFLYQSEDDVLVADVHYIKSADYTGYVHCCGKGCPACSKGIRTQAKLFIPVYNIQANEIQFWDRTLFIEAQLQQDVFSKFPNPSEYVFRITRHGVARSVDTRYAIEAIGTNTFKPYAQILAENNATLPEYYSNICKEVTIAEMQAYLASGDKPSNGYSPNEEYTPIPRTVVDSSSLSTPEFAAPPDFIPADLEEVEDAVEAADSTSTDLDAEEPTF